MSVRFYQFGRIVGGTDASGGSIPSADAAYGPPELMSGTLVAGINTFTFSASLKSLRIYNTHDTAYMDYSFDGVTWFTLQPYQVIEENVSSTVVYLQPHVAGTFPTYELFGILQA